MSIMEQLETQFRALHQQAYEEYEENLRREREQRERQLSVQKVRESRDRELILRITQLSDKEFAKLDQDEVAARMELLRKVRPAMIGRPSHQAQSAKQMAVLGTISTSTSQLKSVPIYASSIMSSDIKDETSPQQSSVCVEDLRRTARALGEVCPE